MSSLMQANKTVTQIQQLQTRYAEELLSRQHLNLEVDRLQWQKTTPGVTFVS